MYTSLNIIYIKSNFAYYLNTVISFEPKVNK